MQRIIFLLIIGVTLVGSTIFLAFNPQLSPFVERDTDSELIEDTENSSSEAKPKTNDSRLTIKTFGGPKKIKTFIEGSSEYALEKNPEITGGLDLALVTPNNVSYYFSENEDGERVIFEEGNEEGSFGLNEVGLVSNELLINYNTETEYFAAYPDEISAEVAKIPVVSNGGNSSRELGENNNIFIKNLNNNIAVVAKIIHRSDEEGVILVSERIRQVLDIDEGSIGRLEITLLPIEESRIGVIRPGN